MNSGVIEGQNLESNRLYGSFCEFRRIIEARTLGIISTPVVVPETNWSYFWKGLAGHRDAVISSDREHLETLFSRRLINKLLSFGLEAICS